MTHTTLIILNAILGAAVVYSVVWLLAFGIGSDRRERKQQVGHVRRTTHDRLAA